METYYTPLQVAAILKVHVKTVRRWLRTGEMPGTRVSSNIWRIPSHVLRDHLKVNNQI